MRKIRKFLLAGNLNFLYKWEIPDVTKEAPELSWYTSNLLGSTPYKATISDIKASNLIKNTHHLRSNGDSNETQSSSNNSSLNKTFNLGTAGNLVAARGLNWATDYLSGKLTSSLLDDDSYVGQNVGNLVHNALSSSTNTIANNILNGELITKNLGTNTLSSIAGGVAGLAGYGIGLGINALGGDSRLSRGIGAGVGKGISMIGGSALSNVLKGEKAFSGITDSVKAIKAFNAAKKAGTIKKGTDAFKDLLSLSTAGKWNLVGMGGQIVGTGLQAAFGPSHEYNGKYGNITRTMDSIYDMGSTIAGLLGPVGMGVSGLMALNKGLSNVFGSTDGMTRTDAILGSAFMPAPVKWLNMWGAKTTDTFNNQSWLNTQKTNAFMGNAFGNLGEKFDKATEEAGKTYGTFSRGSYNRALDNIDFANTAWDKILAMADLNELLKIRSLYMTSINNQRYAQNIQGGFTPLQRGKYGMKILNNATNHNIGMRLLSGAALIDNKQMILSAGNGTKIPKLLTAWDKLLITHVLKNDNILTPLPLIIIPYERQLKPNEMMMNGLIITIPETPQIGPDNSTLYLKEKDKQLLELDRKRFEKEKKLQEGTEKLEGIINGVFSLPSRTYGAVSDATNGNKSFIESFIEGNKGLGDPTSNLLFDIISPGILGKGFLLGKQGFKLVFNKTGLLAKVFNKNSLRGFNFNDLPQEKYVYNNKTGDFDIIAPKKEWIRKGEELTKEYFGEHLYDELVSKGFSPKDAAMVASTRYAGTIDAKPGVLRNLGKNTYGESLLLNESKIQPIYNSRKHVRASLNDANTTLETVFHELGGHGSSFNILYGLPLNISDTYFIRLMKILDHNEKLRPKLRPFYLAVKDGDFKLAETLVPKDSTLKGINGKIDYKGLLDFIKYMEGNLEYTARAIAENMGEYYGLRKNGWNIKLLRLFFTDESVDNLLKNVWNYGVPVTVGGSTAATLYNNFNK